MRPKPACFNLTEEQLDALHLEAVIFDANTSQYLTRHSPTWGSRWDVHARTGEFIGTVSAARVAIQPLSFVTEPYEGGNR